MSLNMVPINPNPATNFSMASLLYKEKFDGTNWEDWNRNLRLVLRYEGKEYVLDEKIPTVDDQSTEEENANYELHYEDSNKVTCVMLASLSPKLAKQFEHRWAYEMYHEMKGMYAEKANKERLNVTRSILSCKPQGNAASMCPFVFEMKGYVERLEALGVKFDDQLAIDLILAKLPSSYNQFIISYQMKDAKNVSIMELHNLLQNSENAITKEPKASNQDAPVLAIGNARKRKASSSWNKNAGGKSKRTNNFKGKEKANSELVPTKDPKEAICFYCGQKGHWKRSCPKYMKDLKDGNVDKSVASGMYMIELHSTSLSTSWILDTGCGSHICSIFQGLKESRRLRRGELNLLMGNQAIAQVKSIGKFALELKNGLRLDLNNCCYSPEMSRNIISLHALFMDGFTFTIDNRTCDISVYRGDVFYFKASPCNGIFECVDLIGNNISNKEILNVSSTSNTDLSKLWHCRLGHINEKRIPQLQKDEVLESFDLKSDDRCESCLLGKMTKSPFKGSFERGEDLLEIVHTDVCGPFRTSTKDGYRYYVTFTDDFSRYGYVYLIKHKSDTFELFKRYQHEVENQLGKKIKALRSDRGGEYLSAEFIDYLRDCGIVSQLSPPRTPQLNGVAERRNRTLLDMVRSMMSRTPLPTSFWGYALDTASHILNRVPTKKVSKTPYEMWKGKPPSLGHIKIWGCEVFVRKESQDKLDDRSEKCRFVGFPPEPSFGYLFYRPKENTVFVARRGTFLEKEMMDQKDSGSVVDLE